MDQVVLESVVTRVVSVQTLALAAVAAAIVVSLPRPALLSGGPVVFGGALVLLAAAWPLAHGAGADFCRISFALSGGRRG